jgi:hypothetical protein
MKKRMLMPVISSLLALCISAVLTTTMGHAACGCTCMIVCNNICEYECTGCGLTEGAESAKLCCKQAREAIGDVGPCFVENSY